MITKGERGAEVSERGGWAGDKAVEVSVGAGIVPNNRKRGEIHELDV